MGREDTYGVFRDQQRRDDLNEHRQPQVGRVEWSPDYDSKPDPLEDLRKWQRSVVDGTGLHPQMMHTSQAGLDALEEFSRRYAAAMEELHTLSWRNVIRKYKLRRIIMSNKLYRLCPPAYNLWRRKTARARDAWLDWKHRNDPYWGM